jgi:hypothetical protein
MTPGICRPHPHHVVFSADRLAVKKVKKVKGSGLVSSLRQGEEFKLPTARHARAEGKGKGRNETRNINIDMKGEARYSVYGMLGGGQYPTHGLTTIGTCPFHAHL